MTALSQINNAIDAQKINIQNHGMVPAWKVEHAIWNGQNAHVAYYQNGLSIVTVTQGQYAYQNGILIASTAFWGWEMVNGVNYAKHIYPDGLCVYSTDFTQYAIW